MDNSEQKRVEQLMELEREKEQALLSQLLTIEAEIEQAKKDIKKYKKEIHHINRSKTWKVTKPIRKLTPSLTKAGNLDEYHEQIRNLEERIVQNEREVKHIKLQIEKNKDKNTLNFKEAEQHGELVVLLDRFIAQKKKEDAFYRESAKTIASLYKKREPDFRNFIYTKLLSATSLKDIPEMIVRDENVSLKPVASFRQSLTLRAMERQVAGRLPEWDLDDKAVAYDFVGKLGIKSPTLSKETYTVNNLSAKEGMVIKPVHGAGSRGVYLVYAADDIFDIRRSVTLGSIEQLQESMKKDLESGWVEKDEWMMEELILEDSESKRPASDVKFYCFYGKVGLILEIARYPEVKHCFWNREGERIRTGKYDETLFKGKGVSQEEIELAEKVSSEIPAPFIRVDFLRSETGLVFGEFTPKPGNYDEFDDVTDQMLGEYYLEGQARLTRDLLDGKTFQTYKATCK